MRRLGCMHGLDLRAHRPPPHPWKADFLSEVAFYVEDPLRGRTVVDIETWPGPRRSEAGPIRIDRIDTNQTVIRG